MTDLGERLRTARQAKGVSLRDIEAKTKISVTALEALERNDYARLPGGIFSRAFVRAYALAVGVEPEEAVSEFVTDFTRWERDAERNKKQAEITPDDREFAERQRAALRTLRTILIVVGLAVVGTVSYFAWLWTRKP
jgi:cytoskeletal protein RodZ